MAAAHDADVRHPRNVPLHRPIRHPLIVPGVEVIRSGRVEPLLDAAGSTVGSLDILILRTTEVAFESIGQSTPLTGDLHAQRES